MRIRRDDIRLSKAMAAIAVMAIGVILAISYIYEHFPKHHCVCE